MGSSPIPGWFVLRMENPWSENNMDDLRVLPLMAQFLHFSGHISAPAPLSMWIQCHCHRCLQWAHPTKPRAFFVRAACKTHGNQGDFGLIWARFSRGIKLQWIKQFRRRKIGLVWVKMGKTIINHPIFDGLYHPSMVIWGMVYYCFNPLLYLSGGNPLLPPLSAIVSALGSCGNVGTKISVATALTISRWTMTRNAGNGWERDVGTATPVTWGPWGPAAFA